jgi:prepilin-type N-terminal cleavage/methylation domain-containing protein
MTVRQHKFHGRVAKRDSGFSLMEVMMASAIFLIASLGFSFGLIAAMKSQSMSSDHYRSMTIARNRIQRARSLNFDSLPLLEESDIQVDDFGRPSPGGHYYRYTGVTNYAANCYELIVSVYFLKPDGARSDMPVSIQTLIARGM